MKRSREDFPPKKKSPFEDIYSAGAPAGGGPQSPLQDLYGGGGTAIATPVAAAEGPPASPLADLYGEAGPAGAAQIAAQEEGNIQNNIEQLKLLLQRPDITPTQRQRIEGMIKRYTEPSIRGFAVGNRVTTQRGSVSNFLRGVGAGAVNYGILGASDLITAGGQLLLPKSAEKLLHLPDFRERIADSQQIVKEWFDPQGYAGGAGTVAGAFAPGFLPSAAVAEGGSVATAVLKPFEVLNSVGLKAVARVSPAAAAIVAKGTQPGATFLQRLAAQWVGSSAVDGVQAADVLTNDQLTTEQKIRALVLTAVASGGAATAAAIRKVKPTAADIKKLKEEARATKGVVPPEKPQAGAKPSRAAEAEKLATEAGKAEARVKENKRLNRAARAEWETANPNKEWDKDLTKEQRSDILMKYRARYAKPDISTPAPEAAPTTETPSAETPAPAPTPAAPEAGAAGAPPAAESTAWIVPSDPNVIQLVTKSTKPGEKPYRITPFLMKKNDFGQPAEVPAALPHQEFDTYEAAIASLKKVGATQTEVPGAKPAAAGERARVEAPPAEAGPVAGAPEAPRVGEESPLTVQPETSPVEAELAKVQAELAATREQRDIAVREAETDGMTGLANQNAWLKAISTADKDPNTKVLLFDLLNVKYMNDKVSRAEADQYIIDAARAVETAVRSHDAGARVFRYGGDEFGVLIPVGADAEAIAATARQILGSSVVDGFPLGLRHSSGNTATQAEAAMAAVKAGETAPKYRPLKAEPPKVEQLVPGVELKKPLAEHTVAELDKLYDKIDRLHDVDKSITDQAYAEGILAISEAKRGLKERPESLAPPKRGTAEAATKAEKPKADHAAAKDAGYNPGEFKTADPRVNEGYAIVDGELKPVDRTLLERIKTHFNGEIAKWNERRARILELPDRQLTAQEVDQALGFGDNRGQSRGELLALAERRIKSAKGEIDRFTRQHARYNDANPSAQPPPRPNPADVTGSAVVRTERALPEAKLPTELRKVTDPNAFRRAFTSRIDKMSVPDLEAHRNDLSERLQGMDKKTAKDSGYLERLAKANEELAKRAQAAKGGTGVVLRTDPRVTGFAAGFAAGLVVPADDDQERWRNAMYLGLAGAVGSHLVLRMMQRAKVDATPDYQKEIRGHVRSVEDAPLEHRKGIYSFLLEKYGNIARRDIGITATVRLSGGSHLPAGRNPGKLAELFGLWRGMTDRWLFGDRVGTYDRDGNWVQFDAVTMQQIAGMVDGDLRTVGDLAAAKRELELRSQPEPRTTGLSLEAARKMYANSAEKYHLAAQELTKFFRAMKDLSVMSGLLSPETSRKMDEQTFYVAVRRLFGGEPGTQPGVVNTKGSNKKKGIKPENLFKGLKGGRRPYQNPVEAAIDLLPRYHRAAELNRLATEFFDHLSAVSAKDRALIGRRLSRAETPKVAGEDVKIQMLRDDLAKAGNQISEDEAHAIISALSDESLNITNDVVRFYRNGAMEAWRVSEPIARAFKSLQPHELEAFMAGSGILTKPTNLARVGITANPVFIGYQAIRDIWQYHMNGTYGLSPDANPISKVLQSPFSVIQSGAYSLRGWLEIMFRTGEYRNYQNVGSGGESVASQGLKTIRGDVRRSTDLLERIKEVPSKNQFDQIIKELRAGNIREAYASILSPIADAGRVGAYLKERGRGADVIEAVYRAKKAGANFSNRGDSLKLQALNRMTLFLNPAIQGLDASRHAFQTDPIGYMARGIAGITLPSMYLWAAYADDEEIVRLRGTPTGKRFWFFRHNGDIVKVPKPIFDGQVFGSSVESYLDAMQKRDPESVRNWVEAMYNDASVNLLPFIGVAPISLMTGKIVGLGSDITPRGVENLDVEYRARPETSTIARMVSKVTAPVARAIETDATDNALSPAGIDFLIQNFLGGSGTEAARALSIAIEVQKGGQIPPKEELPFIRGGFAAYPSMNTTPITEFYRHADRAEEAANTAAFLARTNPAELSNYIETRMQDIQLAKMYSSARQQMADVRKAVEDIRQAPREVIDDKTKRELVEMLLRQLIEQADITNQIARSINNP